MDSNRVCVAGSFSSTDLCRYSQALGPYRSSATANLFCSLVYVCFVLKICVGMPAK